MYINNRLQNNLAFSIITFQMARGLLQGVYVVYISDIYPAEEVSTFNGNKV